MATLADPKSKRRPSTGAGEPWAGLAAAIVIQAVEDTRAGDLDAAAWLLGDGLFFLDGLGMDIGPDYMRSWINRGCPGKLRRKPVQRPSLRKSAKFPGKNVREAIVGDPGSLKLPVYAKTVNLLENGTF
jgi:hypothetical protein